MSQRNPFKSLCKVINDEGIIPPTYSVCRVMRFIRLIKNMKQQDFEARQTFEMEGISQSYLSKIECMDTTPTYETTFIFCQIANVAPCDFLDCVSKTMYMTNLQAAEYIGKKILKIMMEESDK